MSGGVYRTNDRLWVRSSSKTNHDCRGPGQPRQAGAVEQQPTRGLVRQPRQLEEQLELAARPSPAAHHAVQHGSPRRERVPVDSPWRGSGGIDSGVVPLLAVQPRDVLRWNIHLQGDPFGIAAVRLRSLSAPHHTRNAGLNDSPQQQNHTTANTHVSRDQTSESGRFTTSRRATHTQNLFPGLPNRLFGSCKFPSNSSSWESGGAPNGVRQRKKPRISPPYPPRPLAPACPRELGSSRNPPRGAVAFRHECQSSRTLHRPPPSTSAGGGSRNFEGPPQHECRR